MNEIPGPPAMPSQPFDIDEFVPLPELLVAAERHEWKVVAAGCGPSGCPRGRSPATRSPFWR